MVTGEYVKQQYSSLQSNGSLFLAAESIDHDYLATFLESVGITLLNNQPGMVNMEDVMTAENSVIIPTTIVTVVPNALCSVLINEEMIYTLLKMEDARKYLYGLTKAIEYSV